MKKSFIIAIGAAILALIVTFVFVGIGLHTYNSEASLKNLYDMKLKANEAEFDNMKKKISQTAQVTDAQMEKLKEIFNGYAGARTPSTGNLLVNWVKESIPNVDQSTYKILINIITGSRDAWTARQTEAVDIAREYNQNLVTQPGGFFLSIFGFKHVDPLVISSADTKQAFATGEDNDTKLFPTNK